LIEWSLTGELFSYSAALAGALWGVSLQADFATITMKTKAWRFLLAFIAAIFTGPFVLHRFLQDAHPSAAAFALFMVSMLSLAIGPIIVKRVTQWAKQVKISVTPGGEQ
jgi:hypothetical protein